MDKYYLLEEIQGEYVIQNENTKEIEVVDNKDIKEGFQLGLIEDRTEYIRGYLTRKLVVDENNQEKIIFETDSYKIVYDGCITIQMKRWIFNDVIIYIPNIIKNFDINYTDLIDDMTIVATGITNSITFSENLRRIDLHLFDTSKITDMSCMFENCTKLEELNISGFNTSNVKYMTAMFKNCNRITKLDVSSFDTSNVVDFSSMFEGCINLEKLDLRHFNTKNGINFNSMFAKTGVKELKIDNFDISNASNFTRMFACIRHIDVLDLSMFGESDVFTVVGMFEHSNMKRIDLRNFKTPFLNNCDSMFSQCEYLRDIRLDNLIVNNVLSFSNMFYKCKSVKKLDLSKFYTHNTSKMNRMFMGCQSLEELHIDNFNTSLVVDMSWMFCDCEHLVKLNLSNFNTENVKDFSGMFYGCLRLVDLNLESFETIAAIDVGDMFSYCSKLQEIDLSFIDNVFTIMNIDKLFLECVSLKEVHNKKISQMLKLGAIRK